MARIRPYESQVSSQGDLPTRNAQPSDFGGPGLTNMGQSIEAAGADAGQIQRMVQQSASRDAVTDVHSMLSRARATYTQQAADFEAKADPKDPDLWNKFYSGGSADSPTQGSLKWYLDTYRESIQDGQAQTAFDRGAADLTSQFATHFVGVQSRMAGVYAKQQATTLIDGAQATVQTDPSQYETVLAATMQALDDPNTVYGRLSAEQRDVFKRQTREQIASSTVYGLIREDPKLAVHQLGNGTWDAVLRGEDKLALTRSAEQGVQAIGIAQRQAEAEQQKRIKEQAEATDLSLSQQRAQHAVDPKQPAVTPAVILDAIQNRGLDHDKARIWLNMLDEQANRGPKAVQSNPVVKQNLFKRITAPSTDPQKITDTTPIYQAYLKGQLVDSDLDWLTKKFTDARSPDGETLQSQKNRFYKNVEQYVTKPGPMGIYADPTTGLQWDRFVTETEALADQYLKEGKNPRDLFTFGKPDYRGDRAILDTYTSKSFGSLHAPSVPAPAPVNPPAANFGTRPDGSAKGLGYFGALPRPDGKVSTELSADAELDGKTVSFPLLVPTLTRREIDHLLSDHKPTDAIYQKAIAHAKQRMTLGKSPFAAAGEQIPPPRKSLNEIFGVPES